MVRSGKRRKKKEEEVPVPVPVAVEKRTSEKQEEEAPSEIPFAERTWSCNALYTRSGSAWMCGTRKHLGFRLAIHSFVLRSSFLVFFSLFWP
jgi:hypothetical protein